MSRRIDSWGLAALLLAGAYLLTVRLAGRPPRRHTYPPERSCPLAGFWRWVGR